MERDTRQCRILPFEHRQRDWASYAFNCDRCFKHFVSLPSSLSLPLCELQFLTRIIARRTRYTRLTRVIPDIADGKKAKGLAARGGGKLPGEDWNLSPFNVSMFNYTCLYARNAFWRETDVKMRLLKQRASGSEKWRGWKWGKEKNRKGEGDKTQNGRGEPGRERGRNKKWVKESERESERGETGWNIGMEVA